MSRVKWVNHKKDKQWDGTSPEAREDSFAPPVEPVAVVCVHCGKGYMSDRMVWGTKEGMRATSPLWWCPTDNCDGAGYGFDVVRVDGK